MKLYFHPVSAYSQKVLFALYEKGISFEPQIVNMMDPEARSQYRRDVNPLGKVPVLKVEKDDWLVPESSIIVEYLENHFDSGTKLIPDDKHLARRARFYDRMADNYFNDPMSTIFFDGMKPENMREPHAVKRAEETLATIYKLVDDEMGRRKTQWVLGDVFSMGDVAMASPLFYLKMVRPYDQYKNLTAYAERVHARPAWQRVVKEAAPYLAAFGKK
jgi:glutathione S-transferase